MTPEAQHGRSVAWQARKAILAGQQVALDLVDLPGLQVLDVYLHRRWCIIVDRD